jgi:hypothetical protein
VDGEARGDDDGGITEEQKASTLLLMRQAVSGRSITVEELRVLDGKLNFWQRWCRLAGTTVHLCSNWQD